MIPKILPYIFCLATLGLHAQESNNTLLGRWEVLEYQEQGVQVNKKQPPLPQAIAVYQHVRQQRALTWYGYDEEGGDRRTRAYQRWEERDSLREVDRLVEAIAMPYYAVFFPDSTLALYNKDTATGRVAFPESRHYTYYPGTRSIDIFAPGSDRFIQWQAQIMELTPTRLVLFLPEEAELVVLEKRSFEVP